MKKWILILSVILATNAYADTWFDCGEDDQGNTANCQYKIDTDGTLTIRGTGDNGNIGYWNNSYAPWYGKNIQNIVIEDSIKDLGWFGFYGTTSQNVLKIPSSVSTISQNAFFGAGINEVIIPDSVNKIDTAAFNWSTLQKITIPSSVTQIAEAFRGTQLTELVIENSGETPTTIGAAALSQTRSLQSLVIGENVILSEDAFISRADDGNNAYLNENLKLYCPAGNTSCASAVEKILATDNASSSFSAADMVKTYTKTADGYYQIGDELYGSADMMPKGADYSCGATTSICSTVLSEVGGANCDTIKSCRNLAEMADANVYCNSMSGCKELTDMVASGEYCSTVEECKALNDMVGGENCDSLESCKALSDMAAMGEYCSTVAECKRFTDLMNSGYCEGFEACKEMFNASVINYDGKRYGSLEDLYNGNALPSITRQEQGDGSFAVYKDGVFAGYKGKRIYTVNEAENVTGRKNTLKIRYR